MRNVTKYKTGDIVQNSSYISRWNNTIGKVILSSLDPFGVEKIEVDIGEMDGCVVWKASDVEIHGGNKND